MKYVCVITKIQSHNYVLFLQYFAISETCQLGHLKKGHLHNPQVSIVLYHIN